jgi:hypothetical protein
MNLLPVTSLSGALARRQPQDSLPGAERLIHHLKQAAVTPRSGTCRRGKAGPPAPLPKVPARGHRGQTRAAVSQLAVRAAHGPVPETADQ